MKNNFIFKLIGILVFAAFTFAACTEDISDKRLDPKLSTSDLENLTSDSVIVVGFVVAAGDGFTERGVCWDVTSEPTINSNKVVYTGDAKSATFKIMLNQLDRLSTYHARAYATNDKTTLYGENIVIKTPAALPVLANIEIPTISNTTDKGITVATAINITDDGGDGEGPDETGNVKSRGVVYGLYPNQTVDSTKTSEGTGAGTFNSLATKLKGNKTYYLRAYALNGVGAGYSNEVTFTTPVGYAFCTTIDPSDISKTTATVKATVDYNGGGTISDQGFCYGLTENPTIANTKVSVTPVKDTMTTVLTGLELYTTYHVRAYVTNEKGTNYGENKTFKTLANIVTWYVPGDYVESSYPTGYSNWSPDNSPYIKSTISAGDKLEGYVYMGNTNNSWKFASGPGWNGTNYGKGATDGTLSTDNNAENMKLTAGYYKINADATALTYTTVATTWGLMGSFNGWGSQVDMTYIPALKIFRMAITLTSGNEFKFRGTSDWSVNYGCSAADGSTLNAGGDNIKITETGEYAITLDLSTPNAYTYSANRWGVIGGFNSWGSSQAMTWDNANSVFTTNITTTEANSEFKFRANDGWDVNLGGNLTALTPGGDNIKIATAGTYKITLDPWNKTATVTQVTK